VKFEKQLEAIANRAALHAWIDKLPDDAALLILVQHPHGYSYHELGELTLKDSIYMTRSFEHFVFSGAPDAG